MYSEFFLENLTQFFRNNKRYILKLEKKNAPEKYFKILLEYKNQPIFLFYFSFGETFDYYYSTIIRTDEQAYNREYQVFS